MQLMLHAKYMMAANLQHSTKYQNNYLKTLAWYKAALAFKIRIIHSDAVLCHISHVQVTLLE